MMKTYTTKHSAQLFYMDGGDNDYRISTEINASGWYFGADDLREAAQLFLDLADNLDAKAALEEESNDS